MRMIVRRFSRIRALINAQTVHLILSCSVLVPLSTAGAAESSQVGIGGQVITCTSERFEQAADAQVKSLNGFALNMQTIALEPNQLLANLIEFNEPGSEVRSKNFGTEKLKIEFQQSMKHSCELLLTQVADIDGNNLQLQIELNEDATHFKALNAQLRFRKDKASTSVVRSFMTCQLDENFFAEVLQLGCNALSKSQQ